MKNKFQIKQKLILITALSACLCSTHSYPNFKTVLQLNNIVDTIKGNNKSTKNDSNYFQDIENKLQQFKLYYLKIEAEKKWLLIPPIKKQLKKGDSSHIIVYLKSNLQKSGDYLGLDTNTFFNEDINQAILHFQKRVGIEQNGIINNMLIFRINGYLDYTLKQIDASMKTISALAVNESRDFILINIPDFYLKLFKDNIPQIEMKVIVGKYKNQTPTFNTNLDAVVVCPYWNVPKSIEQKEILPLLKKDPSYLDKHNMEWNNGIIRQRPGPTNSLGRIKFIISNRYAVFMHDTPIKNLFEKRVRMFSHGCIRLNDAKKIALYVLQQEKNWDSLKLENTIKDNKEKMVELKSPIPVYVSYLTAWVDENGTLQLRDDIYGKNK